MTKPVDAPETVKGVDKDAVRPRPADPRSDGIDVYPDPERYTTAQQYHQAQAENLRARKGVTESGELAPVLAKDFDQIDSPEDENLINPHDAQKHNILVTPTKGDKGAKTEEPSTPAGDTPGTREEKAGADAKARATETK